MSDTGNRNRRATVSCTMVLPPVSETPDNESRRWQAQSWVASASQHISLLPNRLGSYISPRIRRRSIGHSPHAAGQCRCCYCSELFDFQRQWTGSHIEKDGISIDDAKSSHSATPWEKHAYIVECEEAGDYPRLMSVFQIPAYMVEAHIWGSYRPLCFSVKECVRSWFYVHSELGNILTHLFGLLVFLVLALVTGPMVIPAAAGRRNGATVATAADYAIVYTYIVAVLFCLAASAAFHTLACHSQHQHFRSLRCDFIGILVLIVGSFIPVGYYGFLHSRNILIGYLVMFVVVGVAGVAVSIIGHVEDPKRARWRPIIFMGISGAGLVPVIHGAILNGYADAVDRLSLWYVVGMALLYIAGTLIYSFKLPERYRPGKHDVLLHSHQIFHVFVVMAAILHYVGIIRALAWAHPATS
ncbi:hypothetical protein LPJ63_003410 [Coemansia sp. RSA 2711]|nr:hypothetical protein LPJ63_003410 [Coemansia sp. RSA 2711]